MTEPDRSSPAFIQLHRLSKTFPGGVQAIDSLDLSIQPEEFIALIGPSGCGKSTLLRLIAGLDQPTQGTLTCQLKSRSDIAYVFQDAHLLPWRKVLGNVALPLELMGIDRSRRDQQARQMLDQIGLGQLHERYPAQLSGGQRMRVSLARAMVTHPRLLLLDEPFAALDEITRQQLDEWLRAIWLERKMTVLFVTHSIPEAVFLANRAIVFSSRPARIRMDVDLSASLPASRSPELRGSSIFAEQTQRLYEALQKADTP